MRWFTAPLLFLLALLDLEEVNNYPLLHSADDTALIILEIFRRQNLWQSTVFVCNNMDGVKLLRLVGKNVQTSVISGKIDSKGKLNSARARLGVVVSQGNGCVGKSETSLPLLMETFRNHQNSTYRWLLFDESLENIISNFKHTRVELDTSLIAVVPDGSFSLDRNLFDFYRKGGNFLSAHTVGQWQNGSMKNWLDAENAPHRKNMHKERISFGLTVTRHKSWDNSKMMEILDLPPGDPKLPDDDCQLMPYHVLRITSEMFNYTLVGVNGYKSPGYPQPNGTYTDMIGAIQSGEIQGSATSLLILGHRRKIVRYLGFCLYFRNILVYLSSNTFSTPTAFIQPFSSGIWMSLGIYLLLSSALLIALFLYESRIRKRPQEISASKSALIVLGSLSGQGEPTNLTSPSYSVLLLTMLVSGVVLNCAYSAVIVRFLLAEPFPTYPTLNDFMRSSRKVAALDFYYYRDTVFGPNKSGIYREIYDKKMISPGGFKRLHTAVDGLLTGKWAHLVPDTILYPFVHSATPQQKCRLFEIPDIPKLQIPLCPMIHKDTPAINMLSRGLTLLRERGFRSRFKRIWFAPKPSCEEGGARQWSAVAIKVLYPAIGLVSGGLLASTLLLLFETLYFRWECQVERNYRSKFRASKKRCRFDEAKNNDTTIFENA